MEDKKFYRNTDEETTENLNINELEKVSGGVVTGVLIKCPNCGSAKFKKTGNTREGSYIGLIDDVEYRCESCGHIWWDNF